jgi:hypothetical protein
MKNLLILVILCTAGYFAYQYLDIPWLKGNDAPNPTFNMYSLPEECQSAGENLKSAFYRHKKGDIVKASLNGYSTPFRRCLRRAGYTASEIDKAHDGIADSAGHKGY